MKREKLGSEILNVAEGTAAIEIADSAAVQNAFEDLSHAAGNQIEFSPDEMNEIHDIAGNVIDTAQDLALPIAALLIMWAGFKKMFEGIAGDKKHT